MRASGVAAVSIESREFQRALLVDCADGGAPYEQRLQSSSGRSAGQRYGFGTGARFAWMSARNGSGHTAEWETRKFLEDGDEITLRGYCEREGLLRIELGECIIFVRKGMVILPIGACITTNLIEGDFYIFYCVHKL